jgi:hypothetical protein
MWCLSSQFFGGEKCDTLLKFIFVGSDSHHPYGVAKEQATTMATAYPCGMTNKRACNGHDNSRSPAGMTTKRTSNGNCNDTANPCGMTSKGEAMATADPYGMTNKRTCNGNDNSRSPAGMTTKGQTGRIRAIGECLELVEGLGVFLDDHVG